MRVRMYVYVHMPLHLLGYHLEQAIVITGLQTSRCTCPSPDGDGGPEEQGGRPEAHDRRSSAARWQKHPVHTGNRGPHGEGPRTGR